MPYTYLKVKDLDTGAIDYRPIRMCSEYTIPSHGVITPMVFSTAFPDMQLSNTNVSVTGCTISIGLGARSVYLKSPNNYYSRYIYGIIRKKRYELIVKNSENEETSYIFEFALARGWYTSEVVEAGTDTPKYYKQNCQVVPLFRVKDKNNKDVTQQIFGDDPSSPYEPTMWYPSDAYYPKGWYTFTAFNLIYAQDVPSYDVNEGSNSTDACYADYKRYNPFNSSDFTDLNLIIDVYACFDETRQQYFLTLSTNQTGFIRSQNTSWIDYLNAYSQYNINGVEIDFDRDDCYIIPNKDRTLYFGQGINPTYESEEDISSGNDEASNDTQSTGDNAVNYGNATGEDTTEYIDFPSLPSDNPATKSGLYRIVKIDTANLNTLSSFLWSTNPLDTLIKVFSKPWDCIISLMTLPYAVTSDASASELKILDYSTGADVYKNVSTQESILFGTCDITESFGNFLDYTNTNVSIYLPFIGWNPLDVQDVMDATLTLVYNIDNQTGQCIVLLKCTKNNMDVDSVTYEWSGNIATQLPLTGNDASQYLLGLMQSVTSFATTNFGSGISINNVAEATFNKNKIITSGRLDSNTGNLSIMYPYIKVERPIWSRPNNYLDMIGQPYNAENTLGSLSGYIEVEEVKSELNGVPKEMRDSIIDLLKEGVYI